MIPLFVRLKVTGSPLATVPYLFFVTAPTRRLQHLPMQVSISQSSSFRSSVLNSSSCDSNSQLDNILVIVQEVSQALSHLSYISPLCSLIIQFIQIRNEVKTSKQRCQEIIDKVLQKSKIIAERLLVIGQSSERSRLKRLEDILVNYAGILARVYRTLESYKTRSRSIMRVVADRGIDDLNQCDRLVDSIHSDIVLEIIMEIGMHACSSPSIVTEFPQPMLQDAQSPTSPIVVHIHTLPPKPTLVVEREGVMDKVINMLLRNGQSRIAILGGEGFGKTTCSLYALHDEQVVNRFTNRFYLSCESITNARSLLVSIAHMLGVSSTNSWSNLLPSIRQSLGSSQTIMCLDNFGATGTRKDVEDTLASISAIENLSLVVTVRGTRRPSSIEWTSPLLPPLDKLSLSGAESIVRGITGVQVVDQHTRNLLESVEGIPLAITLLSNLLRDGVETSSSLWTRWSYKERTGASKIRTSADRDSEEASRTTKIDATIAIAINSPQMQKYLDASKILATLALLPDGFVLQETKLEELQMYLKTKDIHKCIQTLQNLGLLQLDEAIIPHRIRVLSPIEPYCQRHLSSEIAYVSEELTNYYIKLITDMGEPPKTSSSDDDMEMEHEIRNMNALFHRRYHSTDINDTSLAELVRASYLLGLWSIRIGYMLDDILELAIDSSSPLPLTRARCRLVQGSSYLEMGRCEKAEELFRLALNDFQKHDDLKGQEDALSALAAIFRVNGDLDLSDTTILQSKELRVLHDKRKSLEKEEKRSIQAQATFKVKNGVPPHDKAYIYLTSGTPSVYMPADILHRAMGYMQTALEIYTQIDHAMGQGTALFHMAHCYLLQNELTRARATVERGQAMCIDIVNQISKGTWTSTDGMLFTNHSLKSEMQAVYLSLLGHICIREDRLQEAEKVLKKAVKKKQPFSVGPSIKLGWLYLQKNDLDKAEKVLLEVQGLCRKWGYQEEQSEVLGYLGLIYLRRNNLNRAEETLILARNRGLVMYAEVDVIKVLADIALQRGNYKRAEELLRHALYMQEHIQSAHGRGDVLRSMGDLYVEKNNHDRAFVAYREARRMHQDARWVSREAEDVVKIGWLHQRRGEFRLAEECFGEARRLRTLIS